MLELDHVTVRYGDQVAVEDASLKLPTGRVLAVLGPSGCGKSTLLRAVAGLEPLAAGVVRLGGDDLGGVPTHKRGCALMFQDGQLFAQLSVARNVGYALRLRHVRPDVVAGRVRELLVLVGLEEYGDRLPGTLSGGERQRVALARALAVQPRVLLLDEPLSALDATTRERLGGELSQILRTAGTTTVLVTHDHEEAFAVADTMAVMREGRIMQQGPVDEVWRHPADAHTALFLGYARLLSGPQAAAVTAAAGLPEAPSVALRRSALTLDHAGRLSGTVQAARATPERVRLVVEVDGLGQVDAVALTGSHVGPGDRVRLSVDPSRLAPLPH